MWLNVNNKLGNQMRGKRIITGFFQGFVKPTVNMTATVTASTGVGIAIHSVATNTYEYTKGKIIECDLKPRPDDLPYNYHI